MEEEKEDYAFDTMCRVCLTEEDDMVSLLTASAKMQVDNASKLVMLHDVLSYVTHSEVFFADGPHLICNNCIAEACAAYKFKRRCEDASMMLRDCGLATCKLKDFIQRNNVCAIDLKISRSNTKHYNGVNDFSFEVDSVKGEENYDEITVDEVDLDKTIKEESLLQENPLLEVPNKEENSVFLIVSDSEDLATSKNDSLQNIEDAPTEKVCATESDGILCNICGCKKSRGGFRQHMLRHVGEKRHICPFCQKRFYDKGNMKVHIRIHTGVNPYSCDICDKKFNQSTSLKIHKRLHDNVKPYMCHICTYSTRTSSHLGMHIKRHVGIKNYHCAQCEYSACSKSELRNHIAKHVNNKCHVCNTCGKGFARRKNLKTHEKSHTGEKPHVCELCGRGFTQAHSLRSHLKNIHKKAD